MKRIEIISRTKEICLAKYHLELKDASSWQLHNALTEAVMAYIAEQWTHDQHMQTSRRFACYISAEYLIGRLVYNNLYSLGILEELKAALKDEGASLEQLEDIEDAALGNGGLGRLAACFLDSSATMGVPLFGYGLYYQFGLFKQQFVQYRQVELPDNWTQFGDPWSIRRDDLSVIVSMNGLNVRAVPYDIPIIGWKKHTIGTLRLWKSESLNEIDFEEFNEQHYATAAKGKNEAEDITKLLYPNDTQWEGKLLRLKQQYFLCSATMQDLIRNYKLQHGTDFSEFARYHAIQLNDTHPTIGIPELVRLLMQEGISFEHAFAISKNTFSYTNHTVMQEALEKWDLNLMESLVPEIMSIIRRIADLQRRDLDLLSWGDRRGLAIIQDNRVHMAYLAMYGSNTVNGVAQIHTDILKHDVLKDWYILHPNMFQNKTNGITQRRWLGLCNPELTEIIEKRLSDRFITPLDHLSRLKGMIENDPTLVEDFIRVKGVKKAQLSAYIAKHEGIEIPAHFVFDVQVKRMHEYKRQLLNALSIMAIYQGIREGKYENLPPTAFIFGAKAAPGYTRAKAVIRYINRISNLINNDPTVNGRLRVVFVQNYNCSYAERIIPAADISEQISPAGTEASGTGNMKLMLNGAVTLGTYDGANIEIVEKAGQENNYIFGARLEELNRIRHDYRPLDIYNSNETLRRAIDTLTDGTLGDPDDGLIELKNALLNGCSWHQADHYFVLKDFDSYLSTKLKALMDTTDKVAFAKKCLYNTASAGPFSSDRTIAEYATDIWKV